MNGDSELCGLSLHAVSELIHARSVSPLEVVEATIARIERQEPSLNSFITITAEQSLRRGGELTEAIVGRRDLGPLHGIPVSLKDNIDTAGVATTRGSRLFAGRIPDRDAGAWRRLVEAGAVLAGKNNLWELAFGGPHPDYGPTWNPWDTERTCGGTSSGSAAAVAAGLSFVSLGTDTGGSARVPASLCGLVAHKPTFGVVPRDGVLPVSYTMDHVCPMTREVRDAALVHSVLSGEPLGELEGGVDGLTIGVATHVDPDSVTDDVRLTLDAALDVLRAAGARLRKVSLPDLDVASTTARVVMDSEAADLHRADLRQRPTLFGRVARNRLETAEFLPATSYVRAQRVRRVIADELEATLREVDAVVMPAVGVTAFPVEAEGFEAKGTGQSPLPLLGRFTPLANATGHPAVVVPCGLGSDGMPTSLQLLGRFRSDVELLRIARAYERATEWRSLVPRTAT